MRRFSIGRNQRPGVSLVEVLVAIGITVIIFGILLGMYVSHGRLYLRTQAAVDLQDQLTMAMRAMGADAAVADGIVASRTINGTAYASSSSTVILSLPSIDAQDRPISGKEDYAVLYRDAANSARLLLTVVGDASSVRKSQTRQLSDSVKTCAFRYDSASATLATSVSVGLTLSKTVRTDKIDLVSDSSYVLGNKVP